MGLTKHIILVGYMGSGKSTIGRMLAEQLGRDFIDSDSAIEGQTGKAIGEIFAEKGEDHFREFERAFCERLVNLKPSVIATGGGLPCFHNNIDLLKKHGVVVYVNASLQTLARRLKDERAMRPLVAELDDNAIFPFVEEQLTWRKEYYKQAHIFLPNELHKPDKVVGNLLKELQTRFEIG